MKWTITHNEYVSDLLNPDLKVSPWAVNRDFVYDLIKFLKPNQIAELGTFYGCSLFAIAQSLKENNLPCKIYAIDSWEGEEHAGFYGEEVYNSVIKTKKEYFEEQDIELVRMYFDKAVHKFEDNIFDIIHIDGLHTYEATKYDFETYLPKLRENGIILFHDIAEGTGYGSSDFWKQISKKYPSLELDFSWGLGILFPKGDKIYNQLLEQNIHDKLEVYKYRALYDLEVIKNKDVNEMLIKRYEIIEKMDKMIFERDEYIKSLENKINNSSKHFFSLKK